MKYFYLALVLFVFFGCSQSENSIKYTAQDSIAYLQNTIAFCNQVYLMDSTFVLEDSVIDIPEKPYKYLLEEDDLLTSKEKTQFKSAKYPSIKVWKRDFFPAIKLVNRYAIDTMLKLMNEVDKWEYIHTNLHGSIRSFAYPIFLRNYTYCLFYSKKYIRGIGRGSLILYQLKEGKWLVVRKLWEWIT